MTAEVIPVGRTNTDAPATKLLEGPGLEDILSGNRLHGTRNFWELWSFFVLKVF